jgi:hypothetical protein
MKEFFTFSKPLFSFNQFSVPGIGTNIFSSLEGVNSFSKIL